MATKKPAAVSTPNALTTVQSKSLLRGGEYHYCAALWAIFYSRSLHLELAISRPLLFRCTSSLIVDCVWVLNQSGGRTLLMAPAAMMNGA